MSTSAALLAEARDHVLAHAREFETMTDAALAFLRDYLDVEVTIGRVTRSRADHCKDPIFKTAFFQRLAWAGYRAFEAGAERQRLAAERGERTRDIVALEIEDLMASESVMAIISGTGGCTPDIPGD